ncbi:hypothetical protein QMN21_31385, partial [Serratia sp. Se-PFBMAAmG]|nr:hypothetical protein [Serratia sp. Se-PFBMAAmG]
MPIPALQALNFIAHPLERYDLSDIDTKVRRQERAMKCAAMAKASGAQGLSGRGNSRGCSNQ